MAQEEASSPVEASVPEVSPVSEQTPAETPSSETLPAIPSPETVSESEPVLDEAPSPVAVDASV